MKSRLDIEDILFVLEPTEQVSILQPVEDDVIDEPFVGEYLNHHIYGPCRVVEGSAIDIYTELPKCLTGAEVATMESIITKIDKVTVPAIRIVVKPEDKITGREVD